MNLTEKSPGTGWVINVLHHHDAGSGNARDVLPPVGTLLVAAAHDGGIRGTNFTSGRVAHHGRKIFEETAKARRCKPFIAQADAETFDGIGNKARIEGFELLDLLGG